MQSSARVVLAPDKFKGTLTAADVADALGDGLRAACDGLALTVLPIADGGDGTLTAAIAHGYRPVEITAADALGAPATAVIGIRENHAIVELASICGQQRLADQRPSPEHATTLGLGLAVRAALDHGCTRLTLGLGGSASTDGGAGLLCGLGVRLVDAAGNDVPPVPRALLDVATVDLSGLDPRLADVRLEVAVDVDAPLLGPGGAAAVFGPQKGASETTVQRLEQAMTHWATVLSTVGARPDPTHPGSGAAGGTAFGAVAIGARIVDGAEAMLDLIGFDDAAAGAALVITGEGRLDRQTLMGKAPAVVARRARGLGIPVVAVVGSRDADLDADELAEHGIGEVYQLVDEAPTAASDAGLSRTALTALGARIARTHLTAPDRSHPSVRPDLSPSITIR
jgi:glycerate kinase